MEKEIIELIEQYRETKNVDYKAPCSWDDFETKAELAKDIMAFSNTRDGGTLIIGISEEDAGYKVEGMTTDQLSTYDISDVGNFVNERCEPAAKFDLLKPEYHEKRLVVIQVSEFDSVPIICKKNAEKLNGKGFIFKEGQIFIRTDDAKSKPIQSSEEMNKLLGLAITKKGDELLRSIQRVISGVPIVNITEPPEEMYSREIKEAEQDFQDTLKDYGEYGFWDFVVYPLEYVEKRVGSYPELKDRLQEAIVQLRGKAFPYTAGEEISNRTNGIRKYTEYTTTMFCQIWRLYMSGYFASRQILEEDMHKGTGSSSGRVLDFVNTIYQATENLLFVERFFDAIGYEGWIYYRISIGNSQDRKLVSSKYNIDADYGCSQPKVEHENRILFDEFRSLWPKPSVDALSEIFALFNVDRIPKEELTKIVNDFLKRKF